MLLTFKLKHHQNFEAELTKAKKVAIFAMQTGSLSSKDVREIGLPSVIACQVLRKYARNRNLKTVHKVVLTVPGQAIKVDQEMRELFISCLKLRLDLSYLPPFEKVNQIEMDHELAFVTVTINEPPLHEV